MTAEVPGGLGAILLAGGRGTRVDGAVKPLFDVGGRTLLAAAVDAAVTAGADPVTVVSGVLDDALPVTWVRESPPFGGPTAAVVTALDAWPVDDEPGWTLLLACDLPQVGTAVPLLLSERPSADDADGLCLVDASGRLQWLTAVYRTALLRAAAGALPDRGRDLSLRELIAPLTVRAIAAPDDLSRDVDTWEDLSEARRRARPTPTARLPKESP
ncbi:MAG: molybdenum cofactor guanylyltransferase [Actinomycetota bacterium]